MNEWKSMTVRKFAKKIFLSAIRKTPGFWSALHTSQPAQLHDLYLLAKSSTEDPSIALKALISQDEISDSRKVNGPLFPNFYNSGPRFLDFLEKVVLQFEPQVVVETGVAHGLSTKRILDAFEQRSNQISGSKMHLHSIDIDTRTKHSFLEADRRWSFHLLSENQTLDKILADIGPFDMFVHDSDHGYENQFREYSVAWELLNPGGVLLSDDVNWSNAFYDFARKVAAEPVLLFEAPKVAGAIVKR